MNFEEVKQIETRIQTHYTTLHQCPELGFALHQTSSYVREQLEAMGYEVESIARTGLRASIGPKGGKHILLRADMDALPVVEESGVSFASHNGNAHACGHDTHMSMLLGAAQLLKQQESALAGRVTMLFQPDEEGYEGGGGQYVVQEGICDGVDVAVALHAHPLIDVKEIKTCRGDIMASLDAIKITVHGMGGHGAFPEKAIDPIFVATQIYQALHGIFIREVDAKERVVFTICKFQAGSTTNVIPETASMEGTLRCLGEETRRYIKQRLVEICEQVAQLHRAKATVEFTREVFSTHNDSSLVDEMVAILNESLDEVFIDDSMEPMMASEDFSFIAREVPSVFLFVGFGGIGPRHFLHHPKVVFDLNGLVYGSAALARMAVQWLRKHKEEKNKTIETKEEGNAHA